MHICIIYMYINTHIHVYTFINSVFILHREMLDMKTELREGMYNCLRSKGEIMERVIEILMAGQNSKNFYETHK